MKKLLYLFFFFFPILAKAQSILNHKFCLPSECNEKKTCELQINSIYSNFSFDQCSDVDPNFSGDENKKKSFLWQSIYNQSGKFGHIIIRLGDWPKNESGAWWSPSGKNYTFWQFDGKSNRWPPPDGDLVERYVNGSIEYDRRIESGWAPYSIYHSYTNASRDVHSTNYGDPKNPNWIAEGVGPVRIDSNNENGSVGSSNGLIVHMDLRANHPYLNQDVGYGLGSIKFGTDSVWGSAYQLTDVSGLPGNLPFSSIGAEFDIIANGPVAGDNNRSFLWLKASPLFNKTWRKGGDWNVGDLITVDKLVYKCIQAGKSGFTRPPFLNYGSIIDGTAIWRYQTTEAMQVSSAINITGNPDASYNVGITGNSRFNIAFIDESNINIDSTGAAIRLAANHPIAWTPDRKHDELYLLGENKHVWKYKNIIVGSITDNGDYKANRAIIIGGLKKVDILLIKKPEEGMIINDIDDHTPVIFEQGSWYKIKLDGPLKSK